MNPSPWTLEHELNQLAAQDDLTVSLSTLGLLDTGDSLVSLETLDDWYRSGAETYGLRFAVVGRSGQRRDCFMKACVAYAGGRSLREIFAEWLSRRALVEQLGISTPQLYATGAALLVEEYVPQTLSEAFKSTLDRNALLSAVGSTAAHLVNAGFAPISTHDWRSRGHDVVLVDFGQDLGPPALAHGTESGLLSEVLDNLERDHITLSAHELQFVGSVYEALLQI